MREAIIWVWNDKFRLYEAFTVEEIRVAFGIEEEDNTKECLETKEV